MKNVEKEITYIYRLAVKLYILCLLYIPYKIEYSASFHNHFLSINRDTVVIFEDLKNHAFLVAGCTLHSYFSEVIIHAKHFRVHTIYEVFLHSSTYNTLFTFIKRTIPETILKCLNCYE